MQYRHAITLKNGVSCILRSAVPDDAKAVIRHLTAVYAETDFLSRYPDEVNFTEEEERAFLAGFESSDNSLFLVADVGGSIVATAGFQPYAASSKLCHRAVLDVAVQKDFWGLGIGSAMLGVLLDEAKRAGFALLELTVIADNARAVALYEMFGFRTYGTLEKAFRLRDGSFQSEFLMSREI